MSVGVALEVFFGEEMYSLGITSSTYKWGGFLFTTKPESRELLMETQGQRLL